jgi:SNF2 family DNA or RNA helicase
MEVGIPTGPILIVCLAALKLNWRREIRNIFPDALTEVVGFDSQPVKNARWVIVNYDLLRKHAERLRAIEWVGVILDEAHFMKNNSKRTSAYLKLLGVQNEKLAPLTPNLGALSALKRSPACSPDFVRDSSRDEQQTVSEKLIGVRIYLRISVSILRYLPRYTILRAPCDNDHTPAW